MIVHLVVHVRLAGVAGVRVSNVGINAVGMLWNGLINPEIATVQECG